MFRWCCRKIIYPTPLPFLLLLLRRVTQNHYLCSTSRTWRASENYLVQFTGVQLGDPELLKIWEAYELGGDGRMDREELFFLMEDLCEVIRHIHNDGVRAHDCALAPQ